MLISLFLAGGAYMAYSKVNTKTITPGQMTTTPKLKRHNKYPYVDPKMRSMIPPGEDVISGDVYEIIPFATNGLPQYRSFGPGGSLQVKRRHPQNAVKTIVHPDYQKVNGVSERV